MSRENDHQAEPVAWRYRWSLEPQKPWIYQPTKPVDSRGYDIEPLYTHADPGEVERLTRKCQNADLALKAQTQNCDTLRELSVTNILMAITPGYDGMGHEHYAQSVGEVEQKLSELSVDMDDLRGQLAERDALLREWFELSKRGVGGHDLHSRTAVALSASAEPRGSKAFSATHP